MNRHHVVLVLLAGLFQSGFAAEGSRLMKGDEVLPRRFTGNTRVDFFGQREFAFAPQVQEEMGGDGSAYKSPFLAAGLSLIVPGAGEFYTGRYWEAAAFLAADIAAFALAYSFDKRGDRQTNHFQDYANQHWRPGRYAQWTIDNSAAINPAVDPGAYNVFNTDGSVNWGGLNALERALGQWYSHTLPPYGDQQYYELIGKYQQFYQGWDDANASLTTYNEISSFLDGNPQSQFRFYSAERGKANDYYNKASTWVAVAIVNHVVSAVYAALSAGWYNRAHASLGLQQTPVGVGYTRVPVLRLSYDL
jgi:hypothetical protein